MEEEKKKQELASVLRRKGAEGEDKKEGEGGGADKAEGSPEEDDLKAQSFDKVKIPKLEAYSGYEDARPLWLFMKVLSHTKPR